MSLKTNLFPVKHAGLSVITNISSVHFPIFRTDAMEKSTIGSAAMEPIAKFNSNISLIL